MKQEYYEWWDSLLKKPEFPINKNEAQKFHNKKEPYIVTISKKNSLRYIINFYFNDSGYFCSVLHLNKALDVKRSESYEILDGQLFMRNVKERFFDGREVSLVTYLYEPDGRYRKNFFIDGLETDEVEYGKCDVSGHFREMIQFGNYGSILPKEAKTG